MAGCEAEKQELLPFAHRPEGRVPGKPQRYATAMDLSGHAIGLMVTCVDGRPVKIEGNPLHPQSLGASHALAQASVLELYDPDRSQNPVEQSGQETIVHAGDVAAGQMGEVRRSAARSFHEREGSPRIRILCPERSQQFADARSRCVSSCSRRCRKPSGWNTNH